MRLSWESGVEQVCFEEFPEGCDRGESYFSYGREKSSTEQGYGV